MAQLQEPIRVEITSEQKHLHELLSHFSTVLLGTFETEGGAPSLRARPMGIAKLAPDCTLYFISAVDTQKVQEAATSQNAHVFGQSATRFFTLRGSVEISHDREEIRRLWTKINDVWFDGPNDPRAALLIFRPEEAELWDASGANGVRFLFDAARALLTGKPLGSQEQSEQHSRFGVITVSRFSAGGNAD